MQGTSDLTIVVEDRKIHVHKAILRMRCVTKEYVEIENCMCHVLIRLHWVLFEDSSAQVLCVNDLIFGFTLTGVSILIPCFNKVGGWKPGKSKSPVLSYQIIIIRLLTTFLCILKHCGSSPGSVLALLCVGNHPKQSKKETKCLSFSQHPSPWMDPRINTSQNACRIQILDNFTWHTP